MLDANRRYAQAQGYSYVLRENSHPGYPALHAAWYRFPYLLDEFERGASLVGYFHSDVEVINRSIRLEALMRSHSACRNAHLMISMNKALVDLSEDALHSKTL